jgi:hypothetical protein
MTPDTYTFSGDAVTFLGLVGVISAFIIIVTAFRRFFNSPYNVRYVSRQQVTTEEPTDTETPVS